MFTEALFTMAKIWKQSKCPSTDEWRKYRMCNEILPNHEKDEILSLATTWTEMVTITRSEINQMKKVKYCMVSLTCGI